MKSVIVSAAVVLGVIFIGLAVLYWMTPAGNLPAFVPGYEPGATNIHFKHGLGALIVGLGLFAIAWFRSAKR
jgi:hypothetical protein